MPSCDGTSSSTCTRRQRRCRTGRIACPTCCMRNALALLLTLACTSPAAPPPPPPPPPPRHLHLRHLHCGVIYGSGQGGYAAGRGLVAGVVSARGTPAAE